MVRERTAAKEAPSAIALSSVVIAYYLFSLALRAKPGVALTSDDGGKRKDSSATLSLLH